MSPPGRASDPMASTHTRLAGTSTDDVNGMASPYGDPSGMPVSFAVTGRPEPLAPPPVRGAPVVVDASAVVVVGSSMMSGAGRAVEVLVDSPMTRPFSALEPPEHAPATRATERARPTIPVRRKVECRLM